MSVRVLVFWSFVGDGQEVKWLVEKASKYYKKRRKTHLPTSYVYIIWRLIPWYDNLFYNI